jgi:hypothetical protein
VRVILEKKDLVSLLGKAMGRKFEEKDVLVQADPFEVIIYDAASVLVPEDNSVNALEEVKMRRMAGAPPVPLEQDTVSMEELVRASRSLANSSPKVGQAAKKTRARIPGEYDEPINPLTGGDDD